MTLSDKTDIINIKNKAEKVNRMKILKIEAEGIPLFKEKCEIDFFVRRRISSETAETMCNVFNGIYLNNVISFIGINASGKTSVLRLITFVCKYLNNEPINSMDCLEFFDDMTEKSEAEFNIYFYSENSTVNLLNTKIIKRSGRFCIGYESLKSKPVYKCKSKKSIFDFDSCKYSIVREFGNNTDFLLDDVSIMVAFNNRNADRIRFTDMLKYTNTNRLNISEDCPLNLISFFDPSIEYLKIQKKGKESDIRLKFKDGSEITLNSFSEINRYLSSGTVKGINIFLSAAEAFKNGGYLIVDELENHFNLEIVSTLIRFFMDKKVNPRGASLVFSTHYPQLLDEFERSDGIYIVRNKNGITANNLSEMLKRNDIKKSDAYQSGFLEGTVPMYDSYIELKESFIDSVKER